MQSGRSITYVLCGVAALILSGCGDNSGSKYRSYSEAAREQKQASSTESAPDSVASPESQPGLADKSDDRPERDSSPSSESTASSQEAEHSSSTPTKTEDEASENPVAGKTDSGNDAELSDAEREAKWLRERERLMASIGAARSDSLNPPGEPSPDGPGINLTRLPPGKRFPVVALRPGEKLEPRIPKVLIPFKEFKTEGPEGALRVSYDDIDLLKVLNMEPVTPDAPKLMPSWLKELDGKQIRIRGFMYPTFQETGLKNFVLARDNQICCFGRDPKIYDVFGVKLREGVTTSYIQNRPFDVVGVFHIRPEEADGELYRLYEIDSAIVIEK